MPEVLSKQDARTSVPEQAISFHMTLSCISVSQPNTCCIYPNAQTSSFGGLGLGFQENVQKPQECDLGHAAVDKPFRWLISSSGLGWFEAPPVRTLTLMQSHCQPGQVADAFQQTRMGVHFTSWSLQAGFLAHCSHQTVSFSHLNKLSPLGHAAISSFHPSSNSEVTRSCETAHFTQTRPAREQDLTPDSVVRCGWVCSACAGSEPRCPAPPCSESYLTPHGLSIGWR